MDQVRDDDVDDVDFYPNSEYIRTLYACCLVCRDLSHRGRRNLLLRVCITTTTQLERFTWMLDNKVENGIFVHEIIVLSTPNTPSPADIFPVLLAHKLPSLRHLQLRTEMGPVPDPGLRPIITMHRSAVAALSSFQDITQLRLFGLRFGQYKQFLRLISSFPRLSDLRCMQLWFNPSGPRSTSTSTVLVPETQPAERLQLSFVDVCR